MFFFEDKIQDIEELLQRNKHRWHLDAVQWMDYKDVCQIIRLHIYNKWHLWDQKRNFKPWCHTLICHQITNLIRNHYTSFQKPCLKCPHYTSDTGCAFTKSGHQDDTCEVYSRWSKKKKSKHDVEMTLAIENQVVEHEVPIHNEFDYDHSSNRLHFEVMKRLNEKHRRVYKLLFIDQEDESVVTKIASEMDDNNPKYKTLDFLKKRFVEVAQQVMREEDIF